MSDATNDGDDGPQNPLLRLADTVSCAAPSWGEESLDDLDRQVTQALGMPLHASWTRDVGAAMLLAALSPDGGGPIHLHDGTGRPGTIKAPLAGRSGRTYIPGVAGCSEGDAQAIVCAVLRREAARQQDLEAGNAPATQPARYDDLIDAGRQAWDLLQIKAIRDPELAGIKTLVDRLTWALQATQARAFAAETALDRLRPEGPAPEAEPEAPSP